jgi:hypothetical protein
VKPTNHVSSNETGRITMDSLDDVSETKDIKAGHVLYFLNIDCSMGSYGEGSAFANRR